jgi:glycosyltransferase involved in cell wall biosynthesis
VNAAVTNSMRSRAIKDASKSERPGNPMVSVIALCFNHARFLIECLESIQAQTYKNIQLLIMDDCSTDGSVAIIKDWIARTNTNCTFICHTINQGICATLNQALLTAKGKYVSMVSTDDVWMPDKLTCQVAEMESLSDRVAVIYSDAYQIDESGQLLPKLFMEWHNKKAPSETRIFPLLLQGNFIPAMTTLIRRSALAEAGPYDERLCYEDFDMWLRLSQRNDFVFSNYVSAKYRIVNSSVTRTVLWEKCGPRYRSEYLVYSKCLRASGLGKEQREWIALQMRGAARNLRAINDPAATKFSWKLLVHQPGFESIMLLAVTLFAISPGFEKRIERSISILTYVARRLMWSRNKPR